MAEPVIVELGAFAAGEVPPDLQITFTDFDDVVVDLSGFAAQVNIEEDINKALVLGQGTYLITDAPNGVTLYSWHRDDMFEPGKYTLQGWVYDGTKYYASDLYVYDVYDGPGDAP